MEGSNGSTRPCHASGTMRTKRRPNRQCVRAAPMPLRRSQHELGAVDQCQSFFRPEFQCFPPLAVRTSPRERRCLQPTPLLRQSTATPYGSAAPNHRWPRNLAQAPRETNWRSNARRGAERSQAARRCVCQGLTLSNTIARTTSSGTPSPTPHACETNRFRCTQLNASLPPASKPSHQTPYSRHKWLRRYPR